MGMGGNRMCVCEEAGGWRLVEEGSVMGRGNIVLSWSVRLKRMTT
jgi:hypothetical protein